MSKKIAVITGATGGIGKEFVRLLCNEPINEIWAIARNAERLEALRKEFGERVVTISADLSNKEIYSEVKSLLSEQQPQVMYLINNAGSGKLGASYDFSDDFVSSGIAVHCTAAAILGNACIPYMSRGCRIINMASQASFQPLPYINLYAACKAFVRSYTRALNTELRGKGITATAVCPGWVKTELLPTELSGKKVNYFGIVLPKVVAEKALADAKAGKDMSVYSLPVKFLHMLAKLFPQKTVMHEWTKIVRRYL